MKTTDSKLNNIFASLASQHRRQIIYSISLHPYPISKLAIQQDLSLPAIHKHVKILEKSNLVTRRKIGRTNFLSINRQSLLTAQKWLNQFHASWGNDSETLENYKSFIKGGETK